MSTEISFAVLKQHCHDDDSWIVINGVVWDISGFAAIHPGGKEVIQKNYGKDGSEDYNEIHGHNLIEHNLGSSRRIGSFEAVEKSSGATRIATTENAELAFSHRPLEAIYTLSQFQDVAEQTATKKAWMYAASFAEDGITHRMNLAVYQQIYLRPRILRAVGSASTRTTFMGQNFELPVFAAPASSMKLFHKNGEIAMARACARAGSVAVVPSLASYALNEIASAIPREAPRFLQLYVYKDRDETKRTLREARTLGFQAIFVTVDLPVSSRRSCWTPSRGAEQVHLERTMPPLNTIIDADVQWSDVAWIKEQSSLPLFIKGVQCAADAEIALEHGCAGIYLSNHGGRAADTALPGIITLLEIQATCPEILHRMEVVIDGGIRRGSDVLKCLCLGATAVCLGRPLLYSLGYGEAGVYRALESKSPASLIVYLLGMELTCL